MLGGRQWSAGLWPRELLAIKWCQGIQVSMHVVRGSPSLLSSHGRGIGCFRLPFPSGHHRAASRGPCAEQLRPAGLSHAKHHCRRTWLQLFPLRACLLCKTAKSPASCPILLQCKFSSLPRREKLRVHVDKPATRLSPLSQCPAATPEAVRGLCAP